MSGKSSLIPIMLIGLLFWRCTPDPTSSSPPPELTTTEKTLVESSNIFGLKLFWEILKSEGDKNVFISPLSVSLALGMTCNGANGTTREAMEKVLELSGMTIEEANQSYKSLIELLTGLDTAVIFQIANSIWHRQEFLVEQDFIDLNQTYFNAEVAGLDFNDPGAKDIINAWVDQNTNGKIKDIISEISPEIVMYLINAIYFKATWTHEFDKNGTHEDVFITSDGTTISCIMISQEGTFAYFENHAFQAIDLPYSDGDYSMTVFLPHREVNLDSLAGEFTQENWAGWMGSFVESSGELNLPRFKLEYELVLNDVLTALGMGIAFDPYNADFTGINKNGDLYISFVKHITFVEVNETGTEAAAVTVVGVGTTGIEPTGFVMRVDRPFIFVIRDHHSGTLLFMGRIVEPTSE